MNIITRVAHVTNRLFSSVLIRSTETRNIHSLCSKITPSIGENVQNNSVHQGLLLQPKLPILQQFNGLKYKNALRLRCKGCYFVTRQGIRYVMCKLKPRHKQSAFPKKLKYTYIWTYACQGKRREW